jgi:hypothetical protein
MWQKRQSRSTIRTFSVALLLAAAFWSLSTVICRLRAITRSSLEIIILINLTLRRRLQKEYANELKIPKPYLTEHLQ